MKRFFMFFGDQESSPESLLPVVSDLDEVIATMFWLHVWPPFLTLVKRTFEHDVGARIVLWHNAHNFQISLSISE
jgi:hypothetical protein